MLRGELSNKPSPRYGVDYRLLLESFDGLDLSFVDRLFIHSGIPGIVYGRFSFSRMAYEWILRNYSYRCVAFSVGCLEVSEWIDRIIGEYVFEVIHFKDKYDFFTWAETTHELLVVYTSDISLIRLSGNIVNHTGWDSEILNGL